MYRTPQITIEQFLVENESNDHLTYLTALRACRDNRIANHEDAAYALESACQGLMDLADNKGC